MFVFLLLCWCLTYVCYASDEESNKIVLYRVQDAESLAYGFCYAQREDDTSAEILAAIKEARKDTLCTKVYRGREADCGSQKITETVHFSTQYEFKISACAAWSFVRSCKLQNGYFSVALEDIADYSLFLDKEFCVDRIKIGLPPKHHPCQKLRQSAYVYHDALQEYKDKGMDKPIVFFSSGRRGFTLAGEFLEQLEEHGLITGEKKINFFFTALPGEKYLDAPGCIAHEAYMAARREGRESTEADWLRIVDQSVQRVGCQQVYKGSVVFAQDEGNVLASWDFGRAGDRPPEDELLRIVDQCVRLIGNQFYESPIVAVQYQGPYQDPFLVSWDFGVTKRFKDPKENYDVFVGFPLDELEDKNVIAYLGRAYRLFSILSKALGAGCMTGQENPEDMPDRSQHTLLCIGWPFPSFITDYGRSLQKKFGYKDVTFLAGNLSSMGETTRPLIVGGRVEEGDTHVLFEPERVLSAEPLLGEDDIVMDGRVYSKIHDTLSIRSGFNYALERFGTAESILNDLKLEKKDFSCEKVYCGLYVKDDRSPMGTGGAAKIGQTMHMSVLHEKKLSERAVSLLLETHQLQDAFMCVGFEDFAGFCDVAGGVHVSAPKSACDENGECKDARFVACFDQYRLGQPIVFCSSGRDGFATAGEFFCALCQRKDVKEHNPRVYFLFSVIGDERERADIDGGRMIIRAAINANGHDDNYEEEFNACTEAVLVADIYKGKVVFAQDKENLLMVQKPYFPPENIYCGSRDFCKLCDVLVNFLPGPDKDPMSVAYWQTAYCLFDEMRKRGSGCVTGDEGEDKARAERTLLCVDDALFDGAHDFGHSVARKLGYKTIQFNECSNSYRYNYQKLVAKGGVEQRSMPEALTPLV